MIDHAQDFKIDEGVYAYTYIKTNELLVRLRTKLQEYKASWKAPDGYVMGLDTETLRLPQYAHHQDKKRPRSGLDPHMSAVRLVQIYDLKGRTWILDMLHLDKELVADILVEHKWVAHYAVFDQAHIRKISPRCECLDIQCSMIAALLIDRAEHSPYEPDEDDEEEMEEYDERVKTQGFGLQALVMKYLRFSLKKEYQLSDWNAPELSNEQLAYAAIDAVACSRLHSVLMPIMARYNMQKIYKLSCLMIPVIAEMQNIGLGIDDKVHQELIAQWTKEVTEAKVKTDQLLPGVNMNSPKQLAKWLERMHPDLCDEWPLTKLRKNKDGTPKPQSKTFARPAISVYRTIPAIAALLDYKKVAKLLGTYGENLRTQINPHSGRIHPSYTLGETRTGRLSSSRPNGQNMPSSPEFRKLFVAPPGCKLIVRDLSQIEIRVAAELSRDKAMLSSFTQGVDLHKLIMAKLLHKEIGSVSKPERKIGKIANFSMQFGGGAKNLRKQVAYGADHVMSMDEAYAAYNTYHELYAGWSQYGEDQRVLCEQLGYVTTPMGKRRKLESSEVYTKALNCPVQGGAAEVLECAMVYCFHAIRQQGISQFVKLSASVHDEVMLIAVNGYEERANQILEQSMIQGMLHVFPQAFVQGTGEQALSQGGVGDNWADAK